MSENMTPQTWEIPNWERGGEVIDSRNIAQRLDDLEAEHFTHEGDPIPVADWPADAQAEWQALSDVVEVIRAIVSNGWDISSRGDSITLVRETYLTAYVESWYDDTYGGDLHTFDQKTYRHTMIPWREVMKREPFCWLDWSVVAKAWETRCSTVEYHGVTYLIDF